MNKLKSNVYIIDSEKKLYGKTIKSCLLEGYRDNIAQIILTEDSGLFVSKLLFAEDNAYERYIYPLNSTEVNSEINKDATLIRFCTCNSLFDEKEWLNLVCTRYIRK